MKQLQKIISIVLIIVMMSGTLVYADNEKAYEISGEAKLQEVLTALDCLKAGDSFSTEYNKEITEDEFNKIISNIVGSEYTDKCSGEFTFARAVQKLLSFMGYDVKVRTVGPYPTGHIAVATEIGMLDGLSVNQKTAFTVADALRLVYNSINIELLVQKTFSGNIEFGIDENKTLLSVYKKTYFVKGVVTDNSITGYYGESSLDDEYIAIDGIVYAVDTAGYIDFLGKKVGVYYRVNDFAENQIVYMEDISDKNDSIKVLAKDIDDCVNGVFTYYDGNKLKTINIPPSAYIIYNNIATRYEDAIFKPGSGSVEFIDSNSDRVYDVITIKSYTNMIIRDINPEQMEVKDVSDNSKNIVFKDRDDDYIIKTTSGDVVDFSYFEAYDVLSVAKAKNNEFIEVIVSNKFASGDVKTINFQGTPKIAEIDNKTYAIDSSYINVAEDIKAGMYGTALLDFEGDIVFFVDESSNMRYGYIISGSEIEGDSDTEIRLKLLTQENKITLYNCHDKVYIDGVLEKGNTNIKSVLAPAGTYTQQLIRYQLNGDGKIRSIDTYIDVTASTPAYTSKENFDSDHLRLIGKNKSGIYYKASNSIAAGVMVTGKTKIFSVGPAGSTDKSKFRVTSSSSLNNATNQATYSVYTSDKECLTAEVLVTTTDIERKTSSLPYLINGFGKVVDEDGEVSDVIYSTWNKQEVEVIVNNDSIPTLSVQAGDVARITLDKDGKAVAISVVYRPGNSFSTGGAWNTAYYGVTGLVYNYSQGVIQVTKKALPELRRDKIPEDSLVFPDIAPIYIWDSDMNKFYPGSTSEICDYKHDGSPDTVLMVSNTGNPVLMVIYKQEGGI